MGTENGKPGRSLAEIRARTALRGAGLDPTAPLERVTSVTNEVWLTPTHAVRVNRHPSNRLFREALVAKVLPPEVGYPTVVAHGGGHGEDWLVAERVPGVPLAHVWPDLSEDDRHRSVEQLAVRLAALHRTPAPPDLPPIENAPQLLEVGATDPTGPVVAALHRAMHLDHVDAVMLARAAEMVTDLAPALIPFEATTLVHGDVTFENVLWHEGEITALLDLEWARPGPRDLDLDILLRCAAYPHLHVGEAYVARTKTEDYLEVPWWLSRAYPALFEYPRQIDRVRVYSIAYDIRDLLTSPPKGAPRLLPELHAYHRLQRVVDRKSYIDILGRGRI
ncbi:MAG: aminoglycoside phosphotransferase family protein [Acidimicrobiales bacterium]